MLFLDLFSGIGGFRLGMEMAGHECVGHCEIDRFANTSYNAIFEPKEDEWFARDITTVRAENLPRADVWCFGFPCQDISVAGRQQGLAGRRSGLFFTVTRLIRDIKEEDRPKLLFVENVKNLLSVNRGYDFLTILTELDEIGYDAQWKVINSADYVPQNRERIYIIGCLRGCGGGEIFPFGGNDRKTTVKQIGNCMPTKKRDNPNQGRVYDTQGLAPALSKMEGGGREPLIFVDLNPEPKLTKVCRTIQARYAKGYTSRKGETSGVLVPVLTPDRLAKRQNGRRFKTDGEDMFTLTAQDRHGIYDGCRIRRLTPRECWRLQGFPDWAFDRAKAAGLSDTQLYKQAGNSVTVPVVYAIAKRLERW